MARTGIYKSDVQAARDTLLAQGKHPSIDAIRMAMGNTGSKTTIHRYLRELEDEEGRDASPVAIDEAIMQLVRQLASSLQMQADDRVTIAREVFEARNQELAQQVAALQLERDSLQLSLGSEVEASQQLAQQCAQQTESLQAMRIAQAQLTQQLQDLAARLDDSEAYRQSLEDKHQHARQALEHYRESVRQQREQELQKHDQQMQQWQAELRRSQLALAQKQQELTALHQELARQGAQQLQLRETLQTQAIQLNERERQYEALREQYAELNMRHAAQQAEATAQRQQQQVWLQLSAQLQGLQQELAASTAAKLSLNPPAASDDCPSAPDNADGVADLPQENR